MKNIINKVCWPIKEKLLSSKKREIKRDLIFPELDKIKSCLVVWKTNPNEYNTLTKLEKALQARKIDKVCILSPEYQGDMITNTIYIKNEDVDIKGKINNEQLGEALDKKYDLLIDLNLSADTLSDYVIRNSCASCKISMDKENSHTDIMIDNAADENDFIDKMIQVLSKFKKH